VLHLQNKNKEYKEEKLDLRYDRPSSSRIILWGKNEYSDSVYIVLDKQERKYPLLNNGYSE
jgi:hypothetical protein